MSVSDKYDIEFGAGFNVSDGKKKPVAEIEVALKGGSLELTKAEKTHLIGYLEKIDSKHNGIVFSPVGTDVENNETRKLIRGLCNKDKQEIESKKLAIKLSKAMDGRTNEALFLVVVGKIKNNFRVGLITLEKADIVSTTLDSGKMKLNFGQAFPEEYFKIAVYEGNPAELNSFSEGKVSDQQLNQKYKAASDYWIKGFLQSESEMTDAFATNAVTKVVRLAYEKADKTEKEKIIHGLDVIKSEKNLKITPAQFIDKALPNFQQLQSFAKNKIHLTTDQMDTEFTIDVNELHEQFQIKTIIVDNEISISGPKEIVEKKVKKELLANGQFQISIIGKYVYDKYGRSRRLK